MTRNDRTNHMTDQALCEYLSEVEDEYGVRIRVALVPLSKRNGKSSHAVTANAYDLRGKRIHELDGTQCYFPGGTSKTFAGAAFYVVTQLVQAIDTWFHQKRREEEQWEPGSLTPLEMYIANSFTS